MGVNYYLIIDICNCCKRYKRFHIGLSSEGWKFKFRGYDRAYQNPTISTYTKWKELILNKKNFIFDENCRIIPRRRFLKHIESKQNLKKHEYKIVMIEGYDFRFNEFS